MSDEFTDILGEQPDAQELTGTARILKAARPLPTPAFRGQLRRELDVQPLPRATGRLRLRILSLATAGVLLLAVAADGVAGQGPLAPSPTAAAVASAISATL
ncbi:MAG TPA: hypothetical protein VIC05_05860 [Solirubrobacteraceae bacterium]|jgi:hypothetical protein